ncbi:hypothetical protein CICLE_v10017859mg, partial [Citrus x clementina]
WLVFFYQLFVLHFLPQFSSVFSDGSTFGLSYKAGKIMTEPVADSLIRFGTGWREPGREAVRNAINSLTATKCWLHCKRSEVPTLGDWWDVVRQYRDSSNAQVSDKVDVDAERFFTGAELNMTSDKVAQISQAVFNKTAIENFRGNFN